ncbi:MAG: glycosyltransferase [Lachnospiraceae bacterium]
MKKIVMFEGEIETQEYFTYRLKERFEELGHPVYVHNLDAEKERKSMSGLMRFVEPGNTVMVCFNFHGITPGDLFFDEKDGSWFWDDLDIPCYNIVVDHPFYYHRFLELSPEKYIHISIDRYHDAYMKRFFPDKLRIPFLPLAGTKVNPWDVLELSDLERAYPEQPETDQRQLEKNPEQPETDQRQLEKNPEQPETDQKLPEMHQRQLKLSGGMSEKEYLQSIAEPEGYLPVEIRPIDVVFTGNYTPPWKFDKYINRLGDEYEQFYRGILKDLLEDSSQTLEEVAERHLRREIPEIAEEELKETMGNLIFLDLYARSYVRGKAVQVLVDGGIKVAVFGGGWEDLECAHPENLILGKGVNSITCLKMISLAKMSLNVMPWFKNGAHDRIFNTLLNGALLITDSSIYLDELLRDGENCLLYDLENIETLPDRVKKLLDDPEKMKQIIHAGYELAANGHTWHDRADFLSDIIEHFPLPWDGKMV